MLGTIGKGHRLRFALKRFNSGQIREILCLCVYYSFTNDYRLLNFTSIGRACLRPNPGCTPFGASPFGASLFVLRRGVYFALWARARLGYAVASQRGRAMTDQKPEPIRPLAALNGVKPPAPPWFEKAIATPAEEGTVEVAGATIRYSAWGEVGRRGLLFAHGGRAHRNWWRPFAPFFAQQYRVAALDFSGMGDSDWRPKYSLDCMVDEIFAVVEKAGLAEHGRPIVIGHSFGGWVTLAAVEREGQRLAGAVVIDSPIAKPDPDEGYTILRKSNLHKNQTGSRVYPTIEEPIKRFRFLPNQPCDELYLVDYIAREGLTKAPAADGPGWTWKFDPSHGTNFEIHFERDLFLAPRCPLSFIYGEESNFTGGEGFELLKEKTSGRAPFIEMPGVHHHLMMEAPLGFVSTLRTLLTCWPVRAGL